MKELLHNIEKDNRKKINETLKSLLAELYVDDGELSEAAPGFAASPLPHRSTNGCTPARLPNSAKALPSAPSC